VARLFFAIWPPDDARDALARLAGDVAQVAEGKPVEAAKIHLTLAFLGEVDEARIAALAAHARALDSARFTLVLDRVGSFRRSRVAWAGSSVVPGALVTLQGRLEQGLRAAGFALDERPFSPHVTLARKTRKSVPMASIEAIELRCEAVALVQSRPGTGTYSTLESWPLARG
jgi:2'-5' RNA ligase